jgi:2-polyprenyl-3-methyl-5-hydroxy-6-metoxy-1,4-benzoquinol methylase
MEGGARSSGDTTVRLPNHVMKPSMDKRPCVVCETREFARTYCTIDKQDYLRCGQCGLIYIDRLLQADEMYTAYSGNAFKSWRRKLIAPYRRFSQARRFAQSMQRARNIFAFARGQLTALPKNHGVFLDIGCNKGFLLAAALESGWDIYGIELVPEQIRPFVNSHRQYRDHIFTERFEDARRHLADNMFDLITGIDVVEHFENVERDLRGIYAVLKPGGACVLQTPDAGCDRAQQTGCDWGALKPLEHLHLFGALNFAALAKRVGFSGAEDFAAFEEADGNFVAVLRK